MEAEIDDAALISIDSKGIDIRVRQGAQVWKTGDIDCYIHFPYGFNSSSELGFCK